MSNGADNFYTSDRVTVQKVTFKNQYQMNVAGNLFVPNDLNRNAKHPAIVVGHPMGAVKEQSANLYATKMAEQGFVAHVHRPALLGRERRPAAQRWFRRTSTPRRSAPRSTSWAPSRSSTGSGSARSASAAAAASSSARPRSTRA